MVDFPPNVRSDICEVVSETVVETQLDLLLNTYPEKERDEITEVVRVRKEQQ